MASKCGLKQIGFCNAGTLDTTPADPLVVGFRKGATLEITPKDIKDYRNRSLRNMINFKADAESLQPSMRLISKMHSWLNQQADVQLVTNKQPATPDPKEDVFKFEGSYLAGIDFELVISQEMRSFKITTEAAFEYALARTFINGAYTEEWTPMGVTGEGADLTLYRAPYYLEIEYPTGQEIFSKTDIIDRKLTIKTKGKKSIYNQSIVDYLSCTLELTARNADIQKVFDEMGKSMSGTVTWKEQNNNTFFDQFAFAANALTVRNEFKIDDSERQLKVILEGDVPVWDVTFQFGAAYGGDAADTTGLKGGTMNLG